MKGPDVTLTDIFAKPLEVLLCILVGLAFPLLTVVFLGLIFGFFLHESFHHSSSATIVVSATITVATGIWFWVAIKSWRSPRDSNRILLMSTSVAGAFAILLFTVGWAFSMPTYVNPTTVAKRNAMNLASVCAAAEAAGYPLLDEDSLENTLKNISIGVQVDDPDSPFFDSFLGIPNLDEEKQQMAAKYLKIENGKLVYIGHS